MQAKIAEYEEQLEALLAKCSNLEKQKSRLQSEVEVLIMDLEKATTHAQQLEKRCAILERSNIELKNKVEEVTILMENAQRDARQKAAELAKLTHEYEKLRDLKEQLARENKKLIGMSFHIPVLLPKPLSFCRRLERREEPDQRLSPTNPRVRDRDQATGE